MLPFLFPLRCQDCIQYVILSFILLFSIISDRLSKSGRMFEEATMKHLKEYGESGLRTLALAYKKLEEAEYFTWNEEFQEAKTSIGGDREMMLENLSDVMERDLILIGATAVEDKLQKGVGESSHENNLVIAVLCFLFQVPF